MSSRALKRAQKELEEKKIAAELEAEESDDEIVSAPVQKAKPSAFALLGEVEDEDNEEDADVEKDDTEQSGLDETPAAQQITPTSAKTTSTKSSKKKKKKGKKGQSANKDANVDELLDSLARNAANAKGGDMGGGEGNHADNNDFYSLLAVESSNLHVLNEMRKLFGRDAVEAERRETQQAGRAQHGRQVGQQSNRLATIARRRNIFVQGKEEWPSAPSGGLGMEVVEKRDGGVVEYRFVHSTAYQGTQREFEIAVASMDPQRLIAMLQHNPYHIATLSQVSEIAKHQGDPSGAGELLERALFSFGRSIHSTFAGKLAEGKARLDFRRPENREFALVIWRYMENLKLRATWKTVFEWSKLLFALDPENDPYCQALVLDQYALRARQSEHLIQIAENPVFKKVLTSYGEPTPFFGFEASVALACSQAGDQEGATKRLQASATKHPWLYSALYKDLQIEPIPPSIWGKLPPDDGASLLTEMYISRAKDIWNTPEATSFLISAVQSIPRSPTFTDSPETVIEQECFKEEPFIRHVILSEKPNWIGMLPEKPDQDSLRASDPVPPVDNIESYHVELPLASRVVDEGQARRILEQIQQLALRGRRPDGQGDGHDDGGDGHNWAEEVDEDGVWDE